MSMEQNVTTYPLDELLRGSKECGCGRSHSCMLRSFAVTEDGAERLLPAILKRLKARSVHFVADERSMQAIGRRAMEYLGSLGFTVSKSSFPAQPALVCDHVSAGDLLLHIPQSAQVLIAVGDRSICDLAKYAALKNGIPVIVLPASASTDSYASPSAEFLENDHRVRLPAAAPVAVLADLAVLCAAPLELTNAGVGAALANYVSLADWQLSVTATGSYLCPTLAEELLSRTDALLAALRRGLSVRTPQALSPLITCLVAGGVVAQLAGTDAPIRGNEAALAYYLEHKLVEEGITDYSFDALRGLAALYSVRMYEAQRGRTPDFDSALTLFEDFGWSYSNREIFRVFGEAYARTVLSRSNGSGFYNRDAHRSRIIRLKENYERTMGMALGFLPPYTVLLAQLRALSFPCSLADLGFTREEALDALVWCKEPFQRYGIFQLLWDTGSLEYAAERLTEKMG